ncbi:cytochrome d ubiquinol oxidase subunit II, partial [Francisella tularensis]|uniref:cytochrome d ubiquinol oxidase subunit II n=1 Tax=Francisella tularensis TaxID=263 RepID=UPI002381CDB4
HLLKTFALLFGIFGLNMALIHGSAYAKLRNSGNLRDRFRKITNATASVYIVLFIIAAIWITFIPVYQFTTDASLAHLSYDL